MRFRERKLLTEVILVPVGACHRLPSLMSPECPRPGRGLQRIRASDSGVGWGQRPLNPPINPPMPSFFHPFLLSSFLFPYTDLTEFQFLIWQSLIFTKTLPPPCPVHLAGWHTAGFPHFFSILDPGHPCNHLISSPVKLGYCPLIHRAVVKSWHSSPTPP